MMGGTFTAAVAVQIAKQLPSMAAATILTVAFALGAGWLTAKRTGISMASSLIGSLGPMTALLIWREQPRERNMQKLKNSPASQSQSQCHPCRMFHADHNLISFHVRNSFP